MSVNSEIPHERWINEAALQAARALCLRAKCGYAVCNREFTGTRKLKYDRTCCVHAEWRAIMDALRRNPDAIKGSRLYFARVDESGAIKPSGEPFCTVCSRLALDSGISEFVLQHAEGIGAYQTGEYNELSYVFHKQ